MGRLLDHNLTSLDRSAVQSSTNVMDTSPSEDKGISLCDATTRVPTMVHPTHLLHLSPSRVEMGTECQAVFPRQQGFRSLSHFQKHLPFPEKSLQSRKTCGDCETVTS